MASTPTTKSQVQAYRFVLRRMQHALVRKDAVMLHDPLRTQSRATAVGVIVAAIGMLGFMIFGILKPSTPPPNEGIVISKSGQIYVKLAATQNSPEMLIPTFNLASARLILMGQQQANAQGGGAQAAPAGGGSVVEPQVVPDNRLENIPKGRKQGIPDGPTLLPTEDQRISDNWAVCDNLLMAQDLNEDVALEKAVHQSAVIAGVSDLGDPLKGNQALLLQGEDGVYMVYRPRESVNRSSNMVRAKVDINQKWLTGPLGISEATPRKSSFGLLNAIDKVEELKVPEIPGKGGTGPDLGGVAVKVGEVFFVERTGGKQYFVLLQGGKQEITPVVADIFRSALGVPAIQEVQPGYADGLDTVEQGESGHLDLDNFPVNRSEVVEPSTRPAVCLGWNMVGEQQSREGRTTVYVDYGLPLPKDKDGNPARMSKVGIPNEMGVRLTGFYMPPGRGAVVQAATGTGSFDAGPIKLISDTGLVYGIPDIKTAEGLGLSKPRPAPESIVRLLSNAAMLSVENARQTFDRVDPGSGDFNGQAGVPADQAGVPAGQAGG